jgi:iron complex outermembrane receptor protein
LVLGFCIIRGFRRSTLWRLTGFAANTSKVHYISYPAASRPPVPANDLAGITFPAYVFPPILPGLTSAALGTNKTARQDDFQAFAEETLSVLNDHLLISGGVSRFFGEVYRTDNTGTAILASLPTSPPYNLTSDATSVGVVLKPIKPISIFFSRNTTGGTLPGTLSAGVTDPNSKLAVGAQNEAGIKTSFFNGAFTSSFSYFDIKQQNYAITDSVFYTLQSEGLFAEAAMHLLPLYVNLESKGLEFEATYSFGKNFTILGNYTDFKERVPVTNIRLRAVPDHAGGLFADYEFTNGIPKGFGANVGIDYKSDVAGTNASGYTTTRPLPTGPAFVPVQPTFLIAGRTLFNVGVSYKYDQHWTVRFNIDNALNKSYIMAAGSGTSLVVGTPRSWQGEFSYKF